MAADLRVAGRVRLDCRSDALDQRSEFLACVGFIRDSGSAPLDAANDRGRPQSVEVLRGISSPSGSILMSVISRFIVMACLISQVYGKFCDAGGEK